MIAFERLRGVGIVANNEDGNDDDSDDEDGDDDVSDDEDVDDDSDSNEDVDHDYNDSDRESGVGAILLCSRG